MDLALNASTHDLDMANGDLYIAKDQDCVVQYLRQKLKLFQGEWFMDESVGVPYFDSIFVKNPNPVVVDSIYKLEILNTKGVVELLSFAIDVDSAMRALTVTFKARGQAGVIDFSETVRVP